MNFQNRYKYDPKTDLLGKGGFARVYKAKDVLLDRDVAVKVFSVQDNGYYTVLEEIKKVIRYEHPNLLRYYDVAILENTNAFGEAEELQVGIMELANAGDLKAFARENPGSPLLYKFLQEVLLGLSFLHQNGIVHRDLKPQNILLVEKNGELTAKISDFGISKNMDANTNSASMTIGTIEYMAPEQFSPNKYGIDGKIGTNLDLWSFGIMVHELITNNPPFGQRSGNTTAEQIMNSILSAEIPADVEKMEEPYKTVIKKCLIADARLRIKSATELITYFKTRENAVPPEESELQTQVLPQFANRPEPEFAAHPETALFEPNQNLETEIFHTANSNSDDILEDPAATRKDTASNWTIGVLTVVFIGIGIFFFANKRSPKSEDSNLYANIDAKIKDKKYDEVLRDLKDSVDLQSATPSERAVNRYTQALLGKGDTLAAIPYVNKSVELGSTDFTYLLGELYFKGKHLKRDYAKAKQHFEMLPDDSRSQTMLGNMYLTGQGVDLDYKKAIPYYERAANSGNSVAMYSLGLVYFNGAGVEKNVDQAKKWFDAVVQKNDNEEAVASAKTELEKISFYGVWDTADWQVEFATQGIRLIYKPKNLTYIGRWMVTGTSLRTKYARKGTDSIAWDAKILEFTKDKMVLQDKDGTTVYRKINQ